MIKKILFGIIAIIAALMAGVFLFANDIEISISEGEAQSAIDEYLELESPQAWGVELTPKYISIDFRADNSAQIESKIDIDGHGYTGVFDGKFSTGIDYRRPKLYLDRVDLVSGGFSTDEDTQSELRDLKKVATDILKRNRTDRGLDPATGASGQSPEALIDQFVLDAATRFFETVPVYNVNASGPMGGVASLALKDVKFTETTAIVTLSPVTALLRLLAMIGVVLLVLVYVIGPGLLGTWLSRAIISDNED